ncbi:MAG: hypothetical protein CTY30_00845 [Methylocystis sp.]|nr:MAG: hypothetical protein CTY30_00845 [Methylocystis sp.]
MASATKNPAAAGGGVGIDLPGGLIASSIADHIELLKTIAAALTRIDAAYWAALIVIVRWGWP